MQNLLTDILVIGGGGAAARAAWEAHQAGADVMLVTKGAFGAIGTRGAGATASGFSAVGVVATPGWTGTVTQMEKMAARMILAPLEQAYENIIQVGLGMADPKLARILVEDAAATRRVLLELGATFGEAGLRSHGVPIMAALVSHIRRSDIKVQDRTMITDLIVRDGGCAGAVGVHELTGEVYVIQASAVILGTGGDADLFMINLNPPGNTGDGYTLGYQAGAEVMNLEFKQIFIGTIHPTRNMLTQALPAGSRLLNSQNEEFLANYLPPGAASEQCIALRNGHNPFSTRDRLSKYVDIAVISEVRAGRGTEYQGVYLDRTDPRIPTMSGPAGEYWTYKGIDFRRPINIGINHHCSLGGLRIDENAETTVPHLYAAGEAAAGPHGADRMGGHRLLASQVFGARAGRHAAAVTRQQKFSAVEGKIWQEAEERIEGLRQHQGTENPQILKKQLQRSAYFDLLVIRSREGLMKFEDEVKDLETLLSHLGITGPSGITEALELQNLLLLARIETAVFLHRTESRGPHYRVDYPGQDDENWQKCVTVKKVNGQLQMGTLALDPTWQNKGDEKIGYWG